MTAPRSRISAVANWLWVPLLLLVLILFLALHSVRSEIRRSLAEAELLQHETVTLQHRIRASARPPSPAVAPPTAAPPVSSPTTRVQKTGGAAGLSGISDINALADPDVAAPVVRRQRRSAMANYRTAIDALQLAPAEKERLKQLIIERWNAQMDVKDILQREGEAPPELRKQMLALVVADADQETSALLGEERSATFQSVFAEQTTKKMNSGLFTAAWDAGAPLSDDQQTLVARAMVQAGKQFSSPQAANEIDPASGLSRADLALIQQSAAFLSPEQVAVIRADKIGEAEYQRAAREAKQRKQAEAGGRAPP